MSCRIIAWLPTGEDKKLKLWIAVAEGLTIQIVVLVVLPAKARHLDVCVPQWEHAKKCQLERIWDCLAAS